MAAKRILVLDDEPNIGGSLRLILEREGYAVTLARTIAEAKPAAERADLLLLDVRLPGRQRHRIPAAACASASSSRPPS